MSAQTIDGTVSIKDNSAERVAFELMELISLHEEDKKTRDYYLKLYNECRLVVNGYNFDYIQEHRKKQ